MATNYATASYQEIIDISTVPNAVSIIGIHTPIGQKPYGMLSGFFSQFRKYKYLGCDLVVQPAATLPADPLSVSYDSSEVSSDPRDLLNPIMFKGCHGENLNSALNTVYKNTGFDFSSNGITKSDITFLESTNAAGEGDGMYYSALSDRSFRKYGVLEPFRIRGLHPLVHDLVSQMPINPGGSLLLTDEENGQTFPDVNFGTEVEFQSGSPEKKIWFREGVEPSVWDGNVYSTTAPGALGAKQGVFTNRMKPLGWLDTVGIQNQESAKAIAYLNASNEFSRVTDETFRRQDPIPTLQMLPKLFMGCLIMPPCFKSILTFRMVLTHKFAFKGFSTSKNYSLSAGMDDPRVAYYSNLPDIVTNAVATSLSEIYSDYTEGASVDGVATDQMEVTSGVY